MDMFELVYNQDSATTNKRSSKKKMMGDDYYKKSLGPRLGDDER